MGLPVDIGTGTSILFGTSGFAAELTSVSMDGISREIVETSHLGTPIAGAGKLGSKTFIAGDLSDPGTLSIEGHFDADIIPPLEAAAELITITFPLGAGESVASTWVFQGQMINYNPTIPLEDKMTFTADVKAVGEITVTAAT